MKLRIYEKKDAILKYLKDLNSLSINKKENLKIKEKYYASSMIAFSILNDFLVLGDEVIDILDLEIAQTYREIFEILEKNNIITKEEFLYCRKMSFLRNRLAHEYGEITLDELWELIEKIPEIKNIIEKLLKVVEKEN